MTLARDSLRGVLRDLGCSAYRTMFAGQAKVADWCQYLTAYRPEQPSCMVVP